MLIGDARSAALQALGRVRRDGVFAADALEASTGALDERDRALAEHLCLSAVQNQRWLDWCIAALTPLSKLEPKVLDILRLGAVQLFFTDKIPKSAAVNTCVELTKSVSPRAAGLVNAVLRKLSTMDAPPEPPSLAIRYSLPDWLAERLTDILGAEGAQRFAEASNRQAPVSLYLSPLAKDREAQLSLHPWLPGAMRAPSAAHAAALAREGAAVIADDGAALVVSALDPRPGELIWDVCAAPGGKSFLSAFAMDNQGRILATDLSEKKIAAMRQTAERLQVLCVDARQADARSFAPDCEFDAVLCDVPCSGFGVLRKKPDIRRKTAEQIRGLPDIQLAILENAARFVRPGGRLVYSTCTILPEENEAVCARFLAEREDFCPEGFLAGRAPGGMLTLWPHIDETDGFFICKMRRI